MDLVEWAVSLAERHLAQPLPRRWAHTQGVGRKAESLAALVGTDAPLLAAAGWLHDLGYSPDLVDTGFHPLDGAIYLRDVACADPRLCALVAYHSSAHVEAAHRGLAERLTAEFSPVNGILSDALTFCDMTTSPDGLPVEAEVRLGEILTRYGQGHLVSESIAEARPQILRAVAKVRQLQYSLGSR
ncbi:HD domain-containing protein [Streptacidiphilus neutrinimicus]|uniref:HD domain-containing protein n=1 Tax=Streptacidiphilus neutrinimicus TaxID=105420 RepID=UPI0005AAEF69|nr:HD domain-containing protein [Streptacidiphilus neutrinimicus]